MKIEIQEGFADVEVVIRCPEATDEIQKIASLLRGLEQKLSGVKDGQTYLIDKDEILYFESVDKRCFIYTAVDVFQTDLKLYELEERLTDSNFFRNSKSQILNLAKISSLCPDFGGRIDAIMENGERIIVSRQYSKQFKAKL